MVPGDVAGAKLIPRFALPAASDGSMFRTETPIVNIAIFTDSFLPHISGVCSTVIHQANELVKQGHAVMIFRPKAYGANRAKRLQYSGELAAGVRDVPLSLPSRRQPGLRVAFPTLVPSMPSLRRFRPDVIHVHTEWGCGWEGVLLAKMLKLPLVGTFHTFFAEPEYLKQFHLPNHRLTRQMMWRYSVFFYNHCDRLLSPSLSVIRQLTAQGIAGTPLLLSNGIPPPPRLPDADVLAERACLGLDGFTFLYVGRFSEEKSLPVLLRAFALVQKEAPESRLALIGDGPDREALKAQAEGLGLAEHVRFLGKLVHGELIRRNAPRWGDVFVTASRTENQPVSILEAMSFGIPVIGADAKGIPELVSHEQSGLLFPPDDVESLAAAMLRMRNDATLRAHCATGARRTADEHDISAVVRQLAAHYQDVTVRPRRNRIRRLRPLRARRTRV